MRLLLCVILLAGTPELLHGQSLAVQAGFEPGQSVGRTETLLLHLDRPLQASDGRLAIFIGETDDKEGDSDLASAGAGQGVVHTGAVAGFPIPPLRYFVGSAETRPLVPIVGKLYQLLPEDGFTLADGAALDLSWTEMPQAVLYRVEVKNAAEEQVLSARRRFRSAT